MKEIRGKDHCNSGVEGITRGHGEGLSVGLKDALANHFDSESERQGPCEVLLGLGRDVLTRARDIIEQWKEHFEDVLDLTCFFSIKEAESEDEAPITLAEMAEVVKKLPTDRVPGMDETNPEMLKALDIVGLSWLTHFLNVVQRSGTTPVGWQTRVVVPIFK